MPPDNTLQSQSATKIYQALASMAAEGGIVPSEFLKILQGDVRKTAHPHRALNNLHRFLSSGFATTIVRDFHEHAVLRTVALEIFSQSQFLADILVRNPELFSWLTSTNVLKITKSPNDYTIEAAQAVAPFHRIEKKLDALKRFQRRELLRIGSKEILREADIAVTSKELSALADAVVETVVRIGHRQLCELAQANLGNTLTVIGLGKLGGEELNFSSDIDLMFVYEQEGELPVPFERISTLHEFYNRLAEFVVRRLTEHTAEGHLYRVDMRLRPEGHSGPLAMSRQGYWNYYETRGELWERQMLIKARIIAGDNETGERWLRDTQPFVFPKTFLVSPLEEISKIKKRIEARLTGDMNIKLGNGGIRDIEFSVQALQLLNAGSNPALRVRPTLSAVRLLAESSYLQEREAKELTEAYKFLRMIEDRLQLLHGLRAHSLPASREEKKILARQLGFGSIVRFETAIRRHRRNVLKVFRTVFGVKNIQKKGVSGRHGSHDHTSAFFKKHGFLDAKQAKENLTVIQNELGELQEFKNLEVFLRSTRKSGAPDWCLKNFVQLAASPPIRRTLLQALSDDTMRELLMSICSRSTKLVSLLANEPLLFESLVGRPEEILDERRSWAFFREGDILRYRVYNEFKITLQLLLEKLTIAQATSALSDLAEEIIRLNTERAREQTGYDDSDFTFAFIALGKLGGREITIGSDLDLLFVYRKSDRSDAAKKTERFVQVFLENFTVDEGQVYEIDLRLRPEGQNAPLATEFEYYKQYLHDRASLWERQSLVKARVVAGDEAFESDVLRYLKTWCYDTALPSQWTKEIHTMRKKIQRERSSGARTPDLKVGAGGLVDVEFSLQILQLYYGKEYTELAVTNSFQVIEAAEKTGLLSKSDAKKFFRNLGFLRTLETIIRLNSDQSQVMLPKDKIHLQSIAAAMGESSPQRLLSTVRRVQKENRALFKKVLLLVH